MECVLEVLVERVEEAVGEALSRCQNHACPRGRAAAYPEKEEDGHQAQWP